MGHSPRFIHGAVPIVSWRFRCLSLKLRPLRRRFKRASHVIRRLQEIPPHSFGRPDFTSDTPGSTRSLLLIDSYPYKLHGRKYVWVTSTSLDVYSRPTLWAEMSQFTCKQVHAQRNTPASPCHHEISRHSLSRRSRRWLLQGDERTRVLASVGSSAGVYTRCTDL